MELSLNSQLHSKLLVVYTITASRDIRPFVLCTTCGSDQKRQPVLQGTIPDQSTEQIPSVCVILTYLPECAGWVVGTAAEAGG
jgi:hypothetical protein